MGVELSERGQRMDEHLDAMRALWTMPKPEFHGRFVSFAGIDAYPRPALASGPPIVVGGVSRGARRRAVTKANGWYVFNTDKDLARKAVDTIRADLDEVPTPRRPRALGVDDDPCRTVRSGHRRLVSGTRRRPSGAASSARHCQRPTTRPCADRRDLADRRHDCCHCAQRVGHARAVWRRRRTDCGDGSLRCVRCRASVRRQPSAASLTAQPNRSLAKDRWPPPGDNGHAHQPR
jgi:Luciferase-like monooxygenase